jgi:DNA-directed RNA polymerase specialized sigma54-like protein
MDQVKCSGEHDIYVPEVFYVQQEGKVVVVTVCRACDTVRFHEHAIAQPHHAAEALKTQKEK